MKSKIALVLTGASLLLSGATLKASAFETHTVKLNFDNQEAQLAATKGGKGTPKATNQMRTCKNISSVIKEDIRNVKAGRNVGRPYNNAGGHGGMRLPSIAQNQEYREYDADANSGRTQDRGKRRIVAVKSTNAQGKSVFSPVYVTLDHYRTFCQA